jgi:hypothetical protein
VETKGQSEDDQSRQMDIWENNESMALFIGGHMEAEVDNITNIERAKKCLMRYHGHRIPCFSRTWWYLSL